MLPDRFQAIEICVHPASCMMVVPLPARLRRAPCWCRTPVLRPWCRRQLWVCGGGCLRFQPDPSARRAILQNGRLSHFSPTNRTRLDSAIGKQSTISLHATRLLSSRSMGHPSIARNEVHFDRTFMMSVSTDDGAARGAFGASQAT